MLPFTCAPGAASDNGQAIDWLKKTHVEAAGMPPSQELHAPDIGACKARWWGPCEGLGKERGKGGCKPTNVQNAVQIVTKLEPERILGRCAMWALALEDNQRSCAGAGCEQPLLFPEL